MFYDIGSVSNRNIQLLYEYRILHEPSDNLTAICRGGTPELVENLDWGVSDRVIDEFESVYVTKLTDTKPLSDCVPFLEFHPASDVDWKWIADFIDVEPREDGLYLYSSSNYLNKLPISIYYCYSLRHIDSMLTSILDALGILADDYSRLETEIKNYQDNGSYLKRPTGIIPNLVKIRKIGTDTELIDSGYKIMTAESDRLFVDYSQSRLNQMEKTFNKNVEFRFITKDHYVLEDVVSPIILISGNGDLVLKEIKGQVLLTNWEGTVTILDCPEVHLTADSASSACRISKMLIMRNSTVYLENQVHEIESLKLIANSICRHWRANVKSLDYVGPGCTYWCSAQVSVPGRVQLDNYTATSNTVFDFALHDIIGSFISDFENIMIVGQKNLTPRLGNCDPLPLPGIYVPHWKAEYSSYVSDNSGTAGPGQVSEITIDGLTCWVWMPESHDNVGLILCVPGYNKGIPEATTYFGAWMAVEKVRPRAACLFLQRPDRWALPSKAKILDAMANIQAQNNLGQDLWYYGFSQGADDYSTIANWATFKGSVIVDASTAPTFGTVGLEKLMVVQGHMTIGSTYAKYSNIVPEYKIYDYHGSIYHSSVNYWTPSANEEMYRQILQEAGVLYQAVPDVPPNALVWLCGGGALPTGGST